MSLTKCVNKGEGGKEAKNVKCDECKYVWPVTITEDERSWKEGQRRLCRVAAAPDGETHTPRQPN